MNSELLAMIITALLAILGAVGGVRHYITKFIKAIKETMDVGRLLSTISEEIDKAISDNIVTKEEIDSLKKRFKEISKECKEARTAWDDLFKGKK